MTDPTALAIRRITIDCKRVLELSDSGLFWLPDELSIQHGYAIVLGPPGTPYHGGAFCFEVHFPYNYPFAPPVFTYLTQDGTTRFNPNLYKNGKVCLSLLNTWQGEPWSGVQSLSSILQSIQTAVLNDDPIRNEPAYSALSSHTDIPIYNRMVQHSTIETAILGYIKNPPPYLKPFYEPFKKWVLASRGAIIEQIRKLARDYDNETESIVFFHMNQKYNFTKLAKSLEAIE
jgi:ubiquitin-conjugating enzyme E2 Z